MVIRCAKECVAHCVEKVFLALCTSNGGKDGAVLPLHCTGKESANVGQT